MKASRGFSLIEVIVVMTIMTILLLVAKPSWSYSMAYTRASSNITTLYQDLNYGRQLAVIYQNSVTTCPLDADNRCHNDWSQGYTIFIDGGSKGEFDGNDEVMAERGAIHSNDLIRASRSQVRFSPDGFTSNTGSIRYCPLTGDHPLRRQVTISTTGGIRYNDNPGIC